MRKILIAKQQALLIATKNKGKLAELKQFLSDLPIDLVSLSDIGITEDFAETGKTYKENSQKKALFYARLSGIPAIADDGGIEIDALDGAPGVKSRRFFGKNGKEATDEEIMREVQKLIKKIPERKRGAKFKTVVAFALPDGRSFSNTGEVRGILKKPYLKLLKGYPYRSFFYLPTIKKYYHEDELSEKEQKLYNHRYKAIRKLRPIIKRELRIMNKE